MSNVLLASVVALSFSNVALADHKQPEPPRPGAPVMNRPNPCPSAKTTVVFSMRTLPKYKGETHSTTFELYDNGAWTVNVGGPVPKSAQGCLEAPKVANVKTAIGRATWKTTSGGLACEAIATHYTEYLVGTKVVLRRELCDAVKVDRVTEKALADAMAIVNPLIASAR